MRDSFVFYKSFYESIKELAPEEQVQIYNAIFRYEFYKEEIELKGVCKSIFTLIIPQLKANDKKYENGKKGGRPKNQNETEIKPKKNQKITEIEPNVNDNVNVNVNVNDNVILKENIKRKVFEKPTIEEIQNYCIERNNGINANAFYDFYESKNWYVGKNKMKDWKACIRTWEQRSNNIKKEPEWFDKKIEKEIDTNNEIKDLLKEFE